jgi:hypothetical protein
MSRAMGAVIIFGGLPDLVRNGVTTEAGHERPVGAPQDDDARVIDQIQIVALRQA